MTSGWPPEYLRSRERHANRGLKAWVSKTGAESSSAAAEFNGFTFETLANAGVPKAWEDRVRTDVYALPAELHTCVGQLLQRTRPTPHTCISVLGTWSTSEQRQNDGSTSPSQ